MKYIYPAILTPAEEGGYLIQFPDFPGIHTDGDSLAEAIDMAEDALNLWLWNAEEENDIPKPSALKELQAADDAVVTLIKADTREYR